VFKKLFNTVVNKPVEKIFDVLFGTIKDEYAPHKKCTQNEPPQKEVVRKVKAGTKKEYAEPTTTEEKFIPSFCLLVVNKQCNFHCRMCNMWKHKEDPTSLKLDEMEKFVDDLKTFVDEPIFIHLIGGETLLWPHTMELAKYITDSGFRTSITTNGWLIDRTVAKAIIDSRMSGVFISLDSLQEEKHDYIRGTKGAYQHVMNAIDYLYEYRGDDRSETSVSIGVTFTIMETNLDEVIPFYQWAQAQEKIDGIFFNAVMQPFDSGEDSNDWYQQERYKEIWPHDLKKVDGILDQLRVCAEEEGTKLSNPPKQIEVLKAYFKDPFRFRQNMRIKCTRGDLAPEVNAHGDISMCFYMKPLGNIRTHNIRDIWYSDELKKMRNEINCCNLECALAVNCFYKIENITDYVS